MSGAWIKGASFRRGFLDKLKDFSPSDSLKGTESRRLLVWMKNLRSGVFKGVSKNEPNLFAKDFSSSKDGRTVEFDRLNVLFSHFSACHNLLLSPQFSLTRSR